MANARNDSRFYGKVNDEEDDEKTPLAGKKKNKMRGRKGKYYS